MKIVRLLHEITKQANSGINVVNTDVVTTHPDSGWPHHIASVYFDEKANAVVLISEPYPRATKDKNGTTQEDIK